MIEENETARLTRTHTKVEPIELRRAVEELGMQTVAKKIGLSTSAISKNLNDDLCLLTTELAATTILDTKKDFLLISLVPKKHLEVVQKFHAALGIKSRSFEK